MDAVPPHDSLTDSVARGRFPPPRVRRFLRYCAVGVGTLALDLLLLTAATGALGVPYYLATPACFLIAVSLNYLVSRAVVFKGTRRRLDHGYGYFILIALGGAGLTTALTAGFVQLGVYYLLARVLTAGVVGMGNYLLNLYFNFRMAGRN